MAQGPGPEESGQVSNLNQSDHLLQGSRTESTLTEGSNLVVKTVLLDPIIRPVSTVKALYGLVIKSVGGVFERTFINQMRFPKLQDQPIPDIGNAPLMDLNAWEHDLDKLTTTRQVRGSIDYLIDGDEYFPRLISAIDGAEERIDSVNDNAEKKPRRPSFSSSARCNRRAIGGDGANSACPRPWNSI